LCVPVHLYELYMIYDMIWFYLFAQ